MTAAHPTLPLPSYARVTRVSNGKSVVVRVNDRGPFLNDRVIDLSYVAAYKLGMLGPGSAEVVVERITPDQIRNWQSAPANINIATTVEPVQPATSSAEATALLAPFNETGVRVTTAATAADNTPTTLGVAMAPTAPLKEPAALSGAMYLQLGAFSDPTKAQALATRVSNQIPTELGASVRVEQTVNNLHRVRIGPFASREAAVQAVSPVQTSTGMAPSLSPP